GLRIDAGFTEGDVLGVNYDPLISKLIAYGESRDAAMVRMLAALRAYPILGIRTNVSFLARLVGSDEFRSAQIHTGLLDEILPRLVDDETDVPDGVLAAAAITTTRRADVRAVQASQPDPWDTLARWGR